MDEPKEVRLVGKSVVVELRGPKAKVLLQDSERIRAEKLDVTLSKGKDKDSVPTITSLRVRGRVTAVFNDAPRDLVNDQFLDVTAGSSPSSLECSKLLEEVHISGGHITVTTPDAAPDGEAWKGTNEICRTNSAYHAFEWEHGKFLILDGATAKTFHGLDARGSIATFTSTDKSKLALHAASGWLLRLKNATVTATNVNIEVHNCDHKVSLPSELSYKKLVVKGDDHKKEIAAAVMKLKEGGPNTVTLDNVQFQINLDTSQKKKLHEENNKADKEIAIARYLAGTLTVTGGHFQISTTRAVERAQEDGKSVVFDDPHRKSFVHFGPEGVARTLRENERFVIFMTANPRVMVNRIRGLVNADITQAVVSNAIFGPKLIEERKKIGNAESELAYAKALAKELTDFLDSADFKEEQMGMEALKSKAIEWIGRLETGDLNLLSILSVGGNNGG